MKNPHLTKDLVFYRTSEYFFVQLFWRSKFVMDNSFDIKKKQISMVLIIYPFFGLVKW
jgi:hypothetical protein